jgi:hypothetical protein
MTDQGYDNQPMFSLDGARILSGGARPRRRFETGDLAEGRRRRDRGRGAEESAAQFFRSSAEPRCFEGNRLSS